MDTKSESSLKKYEMRGQQMLEAIERTRETMRSKKFDTIAVHGIYNAEQALLHNQGSIIEPAYLSAAQHYENSDHLEVALAYKMPSWAYSRIANPTVHYLEETIALMEGYGSEEKVSSSVFASGMSAIFMATNPFLTNPERKAINIVVSARCYGGTFMLFNERYGRERGIDVRWVSDPLDLDAWTSLIDENTRFLYGEMPSNPSLDVIDIPALSVLAHHHELPFIVDATIATPALLRPIELGADIVIQSLSKTMASSGFAIAGAVSAKHHITSRFGDDALKENFAQYIKLLPARDHGPSLSPLSALMILNDMRTLRHKVDVMSANTATAAAFLQQHDAVESVHYPGLEQQPGYATAKAQMRLVDSPTDENRYGHLLSFTVKSGAVGARRVLDGFSMIWRGTDLGRVKSVANIPSISTHQQQGEQGRELACLPDNLIRLCVGHEDVDDVIADLEQGLTLA